MTVDLEAGKGWLSKIAKSMDTSLSGEDRYISRLCTHSEEIKGGELFCTLSGKEDGFYYIQRARKNGAAAVLCDRVPTVDIPYILVPDVPRALGKWAHATRLQSKAKCIAITGSVGKTSTKNALSAIFKESFKTHATNQNQNNLLGVSFTLLSMPINTEILIVELGSNHPGEIEALSHIVSPNDCVITAIGRAHIEAFKDKNGVYEEKISILKGALSNARVFVPNDEPLLLNRPLNAKRISVLMPPTPCHDIAVERAVAFAKEIALAYKISPEEIEKKTQNALLSASRRRIWSLPGYTIIDDAYNASPESMLSAFEYLSKVAEGRRVLILADMLELGADAPEIHREIGTEAGKNAELILLYGDFKEQYKKGIDASKCKAETLFLKSSTPRTIAKEILTYLKEGDTLLFKASHALHADEICNSLLPELNKRK